MTSLIVVLFALAALFALLGIVNPERLSATADGGNSSFFRVFAFIMAAVSLYQGCKLLLG